MRIQKVFTYTSDKQKITLWNDKEGFIKYTINEGRERVFKVFMIRESVYNYYVSPVENRLVKKFKGTKTECLYWIANFIGSVIELCRGKG